MVIGVDAADRGVRKPPKDGVNTGRFGTTANNKYELNFF